MPSAPRLEHRAWAPSFPGLPAPGEDDAWAEETYLVPLGLQGRNIKLRAGALELKDLLLVEDDGFQLWSPATRLPFPIPAALVERELLVRLALSQPLRRERYGADELLAEVVGPRRASIAVIPVRKRRRLLEVAGCRAETAEVELAQDGRRLMTAAAEHEEAARLRRAVAEMGLAGHPSTDYPTALLRLAPPPPG